jgi:hypothetical protein
MIWIAIHIGFGVEVIAGDTLEWVCEKAGLSMAMVQSKLVGGLKSEVWNGEKLWAVECVTLDRLGIVINESLDNRKSKF